MIGREMRRLPRQTKFVGSVFFCTIIILVIFLIYIPVHSGRIIPFSDDADFASGGQWSPDGRWFAAAPLESPDDIIHLLSTDGQTKGTVHTGCEIVLGEGFSWSPDGQLGCYRLFDPVTLVMFDIDSNGHIKKTAQIIEPITSGSLIGDLKWNPRHFWLATIASWSVNPQTLYITDLYGHNLISPMVIDGENLAWSPDGQTLAMVKSDGSIDLFNVQVLESGDLMMKKQRTLLAGTATYDKIAWSPSGHWLVCRHGTYESEDYLFLLATDGSGRQVKITSSNEIGQLTSPSWSPDGKQLIVSTVFITGNMLLSLNMDEILAEKGVKP